MSNQDIENTLTEYPELIAKALEDWRIATLNREQCEALLYCRFKGEDKTATEVKALINSNAERYAAVLNELKMEAEYTRLYERLLGAKKLASLRTAY